MDTPLPRGVSIVIFHGRPKPADVATRPYGLWKRASFVEKHWLNAQPIRGSAS